MTIIEEPTVLNGRYRLTEHIGVGGTADVWRATDELLNREVAVKVLREAADPTERERFVEEAHTLAGFNHPGLVVLLDAGTFDARPFLVMTLADNATLASRIAQGPVESSVVRTIGSQIALALGYVHGRGVVHRDVKPSNVLLCEDGRAVLSDFGIARLIGSTMHHTKTGEAIGSPAYLSPEQVAGEPLTPAVDIYSLGLVLLEALTAQRAFPGAPIEAAIARLTTAPPIPLTLGAEWTSLLTRMTDRDPRGRPTAEQVAGELGAAQAPRSAVAAEARAPALDPEATGPMPLPVSDAARTMALEPVLAAASAVEGEGAPVQRRPRWRRWPSLAAVSIAALAFAVFTLLHPASGISKTNAPSAPTTVTRKHQPVPSPHIAVTRSAQAPSPVPRHAASHPAKPKKAAPRKPHKAAQAPAALTSPSPSPSTAPPPSASPTAQASPQAVTSPTP